MEWFNTTTKRHSNTSLSSTSTFFQSSKLQLTDSWCLFLNEFRSMGQISTRCWKDTSIKTTSERFYLCMTFSNMLWNFHHQKKTWVVSSEVKMNMKKKIKPKWWGMKANTSSWTPRRRSFTPSWRDKKYIQNISKKKGWYYTLRLPTGLPNYLESEYRW